MLVIKEINFHRIRKYEIIHYPNRSSHITNLKGIRK